MFLFDNYRELEKEMKRSDHFQLSRGQFVILGYQTVLCIVLQSQSSIKCVNRRNVGSAQFSREKEELLANSSYSISFKLWKINQNGGEMVTVLC